jgi:predicted ATPase/class 3 adenylate cyclase
MISEMSAATDRQPALPPTGTVTFLFSDIEGSTRLLDRLGDRYDEVLQRHRSEMRRAFTNHGGVERGTEGDSFFVAFPDARQAVAAAADATRNLAGADWPEAAPVRVRMGIHTGEGRLVEGDYVGMDVHRAARIAAAGHGGQVLLSQSTRILADREMPPGVALRDMGEHGLKDLPAPEHLYQLDIDGLATDFPPLRSLARVVTNLPAQLPSIVGREREVEAVRDLLSRSRLVTVTGPGGTGKTRLAQEVALAVVASEPIDVTFVPLDALKEPDLIPVEIIRALHLDIAAARDPLERLVEHFAGRRTLLVLDNLEQLTGAGLIVKSLLDRAPGVSVLASSQAALHIAGEQEYALGPLEAPATTGDPGKELAQVGDNPAVRLFVERVRAVRADFELQPQNAATIVAICARLEGLPLAIELAAAQARLFSPEAILDRVSGRLDALASRRDDIPERQRTLRATVAWSYDLLPNDAQRLFRRMAAFSGGGRLEEIESMAAADPPIPDPIGALETLVDRSLVSVRHPAGGGDRFVLFEAMRTFGRDLLVEHGEAEPVFRRHAMTYRDLARRAEPEFYRASRRAWLDRLAAEHDNLRATLDELHRAGDLEGAADLAADLWRFWQQRGHLVEGRQRVDEVLAALAAPGAPEVRPFVRSRLEEAAGSIRYWTSSDREATRPFYERSLELAKESGDPGREAWARYNLAFVYDFTPSPHLGDANVERANELRRAALATFRELDDRRGIAESLWAMGGNTLVMYIDPEHARRMLQEAMPALEALGDYYAMGWAHISLGMLRAIQGKIDEAENLVLRAAELFVQDGDTAGEIVAVQALGALAARRGDDVTGVRLGAATSTAARAIGVELPRIPPIIDPIEEAEARLPREQLRREQEIGVALGAKSILSTALEAWHSRGFGQETVAGRVGGGP